MARNVTLLLVAAVLLAGCASTGGKTSGPTPEEATLTTVGQLAPDFSLPTVTGQKFTLSEQRGKIVLINWFATWCPPCQAEMPHLQKQVWDVFGRREGFAMVSVAREEEADVVLPFIRQRDLTWNFALDAYRKAFGQYAEAFIPRNTVVDRQGRIIWQSEGFEEPEFDEMVRVIAAALDQE